jgi:hypothetical protein
MEKAKAIKEKRDLAKELGNSRFRMSRVLIRSCMKCLEDVRSFEYLLAIDQVPNQTLGSAEQILKVGATLLTIHQQSAR